MNTTIDSINLFAVNPICLRDFYQSVFGLEVDRQRSHGDGFFLLLAGGCNLLIQDAAKVSGTPGTKGFEIGFRTDDLTGLASAVINSGGSIVKDQQGMGWGQAITVADPEGHAINVYTFSDHR